MRSTLIGNFMHCTAAEDSGDPQKVCATSKASPERLSPELRLVLIARQPGPIPSGL